MSKNMRDKVKQQKIKNSIGLGYGTIYMIKNPLGDIYIGRTFGLKDRISKYRSVKGKKSQRLIEDSIKTYGWNNHTVSIVFQCFASDSLLDLLECFYIKRFDSFNNGLNLTKGGKGGSGVIVSEEMRQSISLKRKGIFKHSEDTKIKMSISRKGKPKPYGHGYKISKLKKGVAFTDAHKNNLSKSKKGKPGHLHTDKHKNKISLSGNPRARKVIDNLTGIVYGSVLEASIYLNVPRTTLSAKINGHNKNDTSFSYLL